MNPSVAPTLLIALVVLAGLVLLAATWWRQGWGRGRVAEPSCGKCGYSVRGLASLNCPECGSDLREVGIATPAMGRGAGPLVWAAMWTLFLPWPAMGVTALLAAAALPQQVVTEMRRAIFVQAPYLNRTIQAQMVGRGLRYGQYGPPRPVPVTQIVLDLGLAGDPGPMRVDLATGAWTYVDTKGQTVGGPGPFGAAAILRWFGDAGFDPTDPRIAARAADVYAAVQEMPQAQGKFTRLGNDPAAGGSTVVTAHPTFTSSMPRPIPWVFAGVLGAWAVVWLVGIVWILRRHARRTS